MDNNELLTIQEFAKLAGVSVQSVYKRLNNRLNPFVKLVDNKKMLEFKALKEIYEIEVEQPFKPKVENIFNLNSTLDNIIKDEFNSKNKQIEKLLEELEKERKHSRELANKIVDLADHAQQLELNIHKLITIQTQEKKDLLINSISKKTIIEKKNQGFLKIKNFFRKGL